MFEPQDMRDRLADIGVADRRRIDKAGFEIGPEAAMKFPVSARLNEPCIPWPCCRMVSAISTVQRTGSPQPVSKERKLTAIAGMRRHRRP